MKKSKCGTSIVEAMIVMLIVIIGVVGIYSIFTSSQKLSITTQNRLTAISIAQEGIEALTNIRDTNWLIFAANKTNCWNTFNYNSNCIISDVDIASGSYIVSQNSNNRWILSGATTGNYSDTNYKNDFRVNYDTNGFFTQSGGTNFLPLFTREIKISYPDDTGTPPQKMNISSIVRWTDSSKNDAFEVNLETTLTNWQKD
ncbi:MAG: hypothetical protein PHE25_06505 [Candidatus Gracilibacteria bacterium]|nr:hypothetical protein [Candidatus Gracilibacteria bacterium]